MASFSTIPEQTPLLDDEARPKQRKFAATTVAVLEGHRPQVPAPYTPPKNKTTNRLLWPGLSDISLHHVLSLAAHATPHAWRHPFYLAAVRH